jgi:dUTPase
MLEIVNLGVTKVALHFGMAIAQLIIEQVFGDVIRNPSQFQTQSTPEGL